MDGPTAVPPLALAWAERLAAFAEVDAVAIGGSWTTGSRDAQSDLDLEVYCRVPPPEDLRRRLIAPHVAEAEIGNDVFGLGDEWVEHDGQALDVAYWTPAFIEEQLDRVLVRHEPSLGYSTAFWRTARDSRSLFDRDGWFAELQRRARTPYPEALRRAIVGHNHPVLRTKRSSYRDQIASAVRRGDVVSVQHRTTALLASWFDIVFAVNRVPHPGEKRLLALMERECPLLPAGAIDAVEALVAAAGRAEPEVLARIDAVLDPLDELLVEEGFPLRGNR